MDDSDDIGRTSAASDIQCDNFSDALSVSVCPFVGPELRAPLEIRNVRSQTPVPSPSNLSLDTHSLLDDGSEEKFLESNESVTDSELQSVFSHDLDGQILIAEPTLSSHGTKDPYTITQWLQDILPDSAPQDSPMSVLGDSSRAPPPNKSNRLDSSAELQSAYIGQVDPIPGEDSLMDVGQTELSDLSFDIECDASMKSFGLQTDIPIADLDPFADSDFDDKISQSVTSSMSCVSRL